MHSPASRETALILTLKSEADLPGDRIIKCERMSANQWLVEVCLETPEQAGRELTGWLKKAYFLAG